MAIIEILTADEVGELIRLSANRVVALARRGEVPYLMLDGHMRFDAADIEQWLKTRRSDHQPPEPPRVVSSPGVNGVEIEATVRKGVSVRKYLSSESGSVIANGGTEKKSKE